MKIVALAFAVFLAFIFMVNLSFKVFTEDNTRLGIGMGIVSVVAFIWALTYIWKKTGTDGKEIKDDEAKKN
jgi:hypothetical protein